MGSQSHRGGRGELTVTKAQQWQDSGLGCGGQVLQWKNPRSALLGHLPDPLPILHGHVGDHRAVCKAWVIGCVTVDSSVSTLPFIEVKIVPGGFGEIPRQAGGPEFKSSAPVNLGMVENFWNSRVCDVGVREGKMPRTHWPESLAKEVSSRVSEGLYLER